MKKNLAEKKKLADNKYVCSKHQLKNQGFLKTIQSKESLKSRNVEIR